MGKTFNKNGTTTAVRAAAVFESTRFLPLPLDEVTDFFAEPANLERLMPGWLRFRLVEAPAELGKGSLLRYRAAPFGFPVTWVAQIAVWEPPLRFADIQRRGPYRAWEHTHWFAAVAGGTEIRDRVRYRLRGGPLAPLVDRLGHRALLRRLFDFRMKRLHELLVKGGA
jgi:ligand-binding SRPBCC domain-containing protein